MTTFSPKSVRSVDTRKSTSVPSSAVERRRPSCGSRFSAMSMPAMIFSRAISPSWTHLGRSITSFSSPSRRWRMRTPFSIGSTWMSLALLLIALFTTRSTRSMIGAASLRSLRPETGSNTSSFPPRGECRFVARHPAPAQRRRRRRHDEVRTDLVRAHQRLVGVAALDCLDDVGAGCHDLLDAVAGLELEILHEAEEQRVGHRDRQQVLLETDRDADPLERDFLRNEHHRRRIGRVLGQVDVGEPELERKRLGDLFLSRKIHPHQHDAQPLAGALVLVQSGPQVAVCDESCLNQALTDFLAHPEFTLTDC